MPYWFVQLLAHADALVIGLLALWMHRTGQGTPTAVKTMAAVAGATAFVSFLCLSMKDFSAERAAVPFARLGPVTEMELVVAETQHSRLGRSSSTQYVMLRDAAGAGWRLEPTRLPERLPGERWDDAERRVVRNGSGFVGRFYVNEFGSYLDRCQRSGTRAVVAVRPTNLTTTHGGYGQVGIAVSATATGRESDYLGWWAAWLVLAIIRWWVAWSIMVRHLATQRPEPVESPPAI